MENQLDEISSQLDELDRITRREYFGEATSENGSIPLRQMIDIMWGSVSSTEEAVQRIEAKIDLMIEDSYKRRQGRR